MKMKEAFPNLKFGGKDAEKFANTELTDEQMKRLEEFREMGRKAGENLRTAFGK